MKKVNNYRIYLVYHETSLFPKNLSTFWKKKIVFLFHHISLKFHCELILKLNIIYHFFLHSKLHIILLGLDGLFLIKLQFPSKRIGMH